MGTSMPSRVSQRGPRAQRATALPRPPSLAGLRCRASPACDRAHAGSAAAALEAGPGLVLPLALGQAAAHSRLPPPASGEPSAASALGRRTALALAAAAAVSLQALPALVQPPPAGASKLPAFADNAWTALGGGPADLTFPDDWVGVWDVISVLNKVETPLGRDVLPRGGAVVARAEQEDLGKPLSYRVAFMRNREGQVVYDRRYNTASLMEAYYGSDIDFMGHITWDAADPNVLRLSMPKGLAINTRVTRRSEVPPGSVAPDKLETSEYMEQLFDDAGSVQPTVKASQCYTKYRWRSQGDAEADGGPAIIATQVVSDYLTPYDGDANFVRAAGRPVVLYTYALQMRRHADSGHNAAALPHS